MKIQKIQEKSLFRLVLILTLAIGSFSIAGCGYKMGHMMHPQVKSIAIAPIKNETLVPFAAADMRQSLCEQFQLDGSLKLKGMKEADCVLYGRVVSVDTTATGTDTWDNQMTFRAAEWGVNVKFEYVVIIPANKEPLIKRREVSGRALYQVMSDYFVTRRRGIQQACREAAEKAVEYTVEAW